MSTKHTAGPWSYHEPKAKCSGCVYSIMPAGFDPAADLCNWPWSVASISWQSPNSEENARLIASAPDLLTAAESAFRALMGVIAIDPEQQDRITAARDGLNLAMCAAGYEGHLEAKEGT